MKYAIPTNLIPLLPEQTQVAIIRFLYQNYVIGLIQERKQFENNWDRWLALTRMQVDRNGLLIKPNSKLRKNLEENSNLVSDSLIFDAVDRLTILTKWMSFKSGLPLKFVRPPYYRNAYVSEYYDPLNDRLNALNAILHWNSENQDFSIKHEMGARHFFTYGVAFFESECLYEKTLDGAAFKMLGTSFDPISIRKLWMNYRLPLNAIEYQNCIFHFKETSRSFIKNNIFHPEINPKGFANLQFIDSIPGQFIYSVPEMESHFKAISKSQSENVSLSQLIDPKYNVEALWKFDAMLPLDLNSGMLNESLPFQRFHIEIFSPSLMSGTMLLLSLYPIEKPTVFGGSMYPDLDSGVYSLSLAQALENHFLQITTCIQQFIDNKDFLNEPPYEVQQGSPSINENPNVKNKKLIVNAIGADIQWKQVPDSTGTTSAVLNILREQARATARTTDSIMAQAMGQRTSATEASNVFEVSMSGITVLVDSYNRALQPYALNVKNHFVKYFPDELTRLIAGTFGYTDMDASALNLDVFVHNSVGSDYLSQVKRIETFRWFIQSLAVVPNFNIEYAVVQLAKDMGLQDAEKLIKDSTIEQQTELAKDQAIRTYFGENVAIDPDQDHAIAINVKSSFIKDPNQYLNQKFPDRIPALIQQIQIHSQFHLLQQQQLLLQQQQQQIALMQGENPERIQKDGEYASNRGSKI